MTKEKGKSPENLPLICQTFRGWFPRKANLAKLHISARFLLCFITTIRPTRQRDIIHFHRKFSAGYPGLPSSLSRRTWGACDTVTRKKRMAKEAQHSTRSNPLRQSSFFHLSYQVESLYCLSSLFPGPPWWKQRKTMWKSHWFCRKGRQFTREGEKMCLWESSPSLTHAIFLPLNLSSKSDPISTALTPLCHIHRFYQSVKVCSWNFS